jgi:hypothetical protein
MITEKAMIAGINWIFASKLAIFPDIKPAKSRK